MARYLGPPEEPVNRREYGPGQHGQRRKGKPPTSARSSRRNRSSRLLRQYFGKQFRNITPRPCVSRATSSDNLIACWSVVSTRWSMRQFVPTVFAARSSSTTATSRQRSPREHPFISGEAGRRDRDQDSSKQPSPCSRRLASPSAMCRNITRSITPR